MGYRQCNWSGVAWDMTGRVVSLAFLALVVDFNEDLLS